MGTLAFSLPGFPRMAKDSAVDLGILCPSEVVANPKAMEDSMGWFWTELPVLILTRHVRWTWDHSAGLLQRRAEAYGGYRTGVSVFTGAVEGGW